MTFQSKRGSSNVVIFEFEEKHEENQDNNRGTEHRAAASETILYHTCPSAGVRNHSTIAPVLQHGPSGVSRTLLPLVPAFV